MAENEEQRVSEDDLTDSINESDRNEIIDQKVKAMKKTARPKVLGLFVVIFTALIFIMIGGLASYYYYTFQSQGNATEQDVQNNWNEVVVATVELTNSFNEVGSFEELTAENSGSFRERLGTANRDLRDILYELQTTNNYVFSGNVFVSRLKSFLDDYIAYLRELQRLIERGSAGIITEIVEVEELAKLDKQMNESYDNLLIADKNKVIQANLPQELFAIAQDVKEFVQTYLDGEQDKTDAEEEEKTAARDTITKFMQAYMDRDTDAMVIYLTQQAEAEFSPIIVLEDSSEITSFKILDNRKTGDAKIEVNAQINKETPDGVAISGERLFIMLKQENKWLIDSWNTV